MPLSLAGYLSSFPTTALPPLLREFSARVRDAI